MFDDEPHDQQNFIHIITGLEGNLLAGPAGRVHLHHVGHLQVDSKEIEIFHEFQCFKVQGAGLQGAECMFQGAGLRGAGCRVSRQILQGAAQLGDSPG